MFLHEVACALMGIFSVCPCYLFIFISWGYSIHFCLHVLCVACLGCFIVIGVGSPNQSLAPHSQESQPHLTTITESCSVPIVHQSKTSSLLTLDLAREISRMVRDVYSEKEVAFAPVFNVKQTKGNNLTGIHKKLRFEPSHEKNQRFA